MHDLVVVFGYLSSACTSSLIWGSRARRWGFVVHVLTCLEYLATIGLLQADFLRLLFIERRYSLRIMGRSFLCCLNFVSRPTWHTHSFFRLTPVHVVPSLLSLITYLLIL